MAVPSTGELSLEGIAYEHIFATYGNRYTDDDEFEYPGMTSPAVNGMEYLEFVESNFTDAATYEPGPQCLVGNISLTAMLYQPAISPGGTSGRIGGQLEINNPESSPYADVSSVGTNPADRQKSNMGMNPSVNAGGGTQTGLNIGIGGELNKSAPHIPASTVMYAIYHGSSTDVSGIPAGAGGPTASKFVNLFGQSGNHSIQVWNQGKSYFPGSTAGAHSIPSIGPGTKRYEAFGGSPASSPVGPGDPQSLHPEEVGAVSGLNPTIQDSASIPSTATDARMSYFYGFNKDEAPAAASPGIYMGPALFTGNGNTTLYNYPVDFSNPSYVGQSIVGQTGRIVLCYRNGTAPSPFTGAFRGDIQLTTIQYNSPKVTVNWTSPFPSPSAELWQTGPGGNPLSTLPATTANAETVYGLEETKGFVNVTNTQSSNRRWNYQADGRGGSPATGVPDPTGALYVETSTAPTGPTSGRWFATRSPSITFSSNSVTLSMYRYGSNVGTCFCGVDIES